MYRKGKGVPQDYAEAMKWYRLAAEQGHAYAPYYLGQMYRKGKGVPQDYAIAHMWYDIGSANGHELGGTNRDNLDLSRFDAAPCARLSHLSFESDRAFPTQC